MEKSQTPAGKISIGLQIGGASLETSNLSLGCLRFFRLALFPVLDPLCLFPLQFKICQYEFTTEAFYVLLVFFFGWVGGRGSE